jgi:hypothetical protein
MWRTSRAWDKVLVHEAFADHWDFIRVPLEKWLYWVNLPRFHPELNLLAVAGEEIAGICLCDINEQHNGEGHHYLVANPVPQLLVRPARGDGWA